MFWSRSFVVIVFVDGAVASSVERVSGVTIDGLDSSSDKAGQHITQCLPYGPF